MPTHLDSSTFLVYCISLLLTLHINDTWVVGERNCCLDIILLLAQRYGISMLQTTSAVVEETQWGEAGMNVLYMVSHKECV